MKQETKDNWQFNVLMSILVTIILGSSFLLTKFTSKPAAKDQKTLAAQEAAFEEILPLGKKLGVAAIELISDRGCQGHLGNTLGRAKLFGTSGSSAEKRTKNFLAAKGLGDVFRAIVELTEEVPPETRELILRLNFANRNLLNIASNFAEIVSEDEIPYWEGNLRAAKAAAEKLLRKTSAETRRLSPRGLTRKRLREQVRDSTGEFFGVIEPKSRFPWLQEEFLEDSSK